MHKRFPRNLGGTVTSISSDRRGYGRTTPGFSWQVLSHEKSKTMRTKMVPPNEGNEVRWDAITVVLVPA
jgi:hypothetical protein